MSLSKIANAHKKSIPYISQIINGKRKTVDIALAIEIAQRTGRPPIEYIPDKIKELALQARPELAEPIKDE